MFLHSEKTPGIAQLSYILGDGGEACVIDPQLDCQRYIDIANTHECRIAHILETHRNEDFISGAHALARLTGASVWHGPNPDEPIAYAETVHEGDGFELGNLKIKVIETPGHTYDSVSYALIDTAFSDEPVGVFTGDTLFIGDVGRTDFYPDRKEEVARLLHQSIGKLFALGDHVQIFPAHGAGSVCGSGMADREFSTIGYERRFNPVASSESEQDFIQLKLDEQHYLPPYFGMMEEANVKGVELKLEALQCQPIDQKQLKQWLNPETARGVVLDVRDLNAVKQGYIRNSLCMHGPLISAYAGWFLTDKPPILLMAADYGQARDAQLQLLRMGLDTVEGYTTDLPLQVEESDAQLDRIAAVTADVVKKRLHNKDEWTLLDVRKDEEVESTPLEGATHLYLGHLPEKCGELAKDRHYTVMCGSDKRATVGASYLKARGFKHVDVFIGSMMAWKALHDS